MNLQLFKNKNGLIILVCVIVIILVYAIDLFKITYRLQSWKAFESPVEVAQVDYFIADTPDVIGYKEPVSGQMISCATTVAYVKTTDDATYRCCETGERVSCFAGNFSSDIPTHDVECKNRLISLFGIPHTLENPKFYDGFGSCTDGAAQEITMVQITDNGQILWKYADAGQIAQLDSALRCILAPILLLLAAALVIVTLRNKPSEPLRKLW